MKTTQADKGIVRGKPKKKAEPHRSKRGKDGKLVPSGKA